MKALSSWLLGLVIALHASPSLGLAFSLPKFAPPRSTTQVPRQCRVLILPGFGNAAEDYTMEGSLVPSLLSCGWDEDQVSVLPIKRPDWLKVFLRGAFDLEFWCANAAPTRPAFRWYLDLVAEEIQRIEDEVKKEEGTDAKAKVLLVGHSAGGWLARAAAGFCSENADDSNQHETTPTINIESILGIVTLGAPNGSPPPGAMDMTRGALRITNECFPGSYHAPSTFYVTVIGNAVAGKEQKRSSFLEPTTVDGFAYQSYQAVCGDGNAVGDGVVPVSAAHVEGAINIDLNGVFHSINVPDNWYGSIDIIDQWHGVVLDEIKKKKEKLPLFSQSK